MVKYVVSFGCHRQEVLTYGMAKILADELISSNFEGCRDLGKTAEDLISVERRKVMNYNPDEVREKLQTLAKQKVEFQSYLQSQGYIFKLVETENGYVKYLAIHPEFYDQWLEGINSCPEEAVIFLN